MTAGVGSEHHADATVTCLGRGGGLRVAMAAGGLCGESQQRVVNRNTVQPRPLQVRHSFSLHFRARRRFFNL